MSDSMENQVLDMQVGRAAITQKTVYLGLYNTPPTDAGGGGEVTTVGTGYARKQLNTPPSTNPYFGSPAANGQVANTADIPMATPSASWGTVTAVGLFDALTGGNLLLWTPITARTINQNDTVTFSAGSIVLVAD
jgi:hypothetical protein